MEKTDSNLHADAASILLTAASEARFRSPQNLAFVADCHTIGQQGGMNPLLLLRLCRAIIPSLQSADEGAKVSTEAHDSEFLMIAAQHLANFAASSDENTYSFLCSVVASPSYHDRLVTFLLALVFDLQSALWSGWRVRQRPLAHRWSIRRSCASLPKQDPLSTCLSSIPSSPPSHLAHKSMVHTLPL